MCWQRPPVDLQSYKTAGFSHGNSTLLQKIVTQRVMCTTSTGNVQMTCY